MPDLITLPDLAAYMEPEDIGTARGPLIVELTLGAVYDVLPDDLADTNIRARAIALEVAARAVRNAQGYASESVDDYRYQRPSATQAAGVYLTPDERSELRAIASAEAGTPVARVRSVRLRSWST